WLSLLRSARRADESVPLGLGSEIVLRSSIPGDVEQVYEIDGFLAGHIISLVGAYSIRRRIDLRVESKSTHSRLVVRLDYPAYGGPVGQFIDRMTARRRLATQLDASLVHFKGLVEYAAREGEALDDL
ncbi:MAG: hypothetical protein ACREM8_13570, partial [Vulcanimicrobiaceae bacterium]